MTRALKRVQEGKQRRIALLAALKARRLKWTEPKPRVHYVIRFGEAGPGQRVFDYWPTTGAWRERDNGDRPGALAVHRTSRRSGHCLDGMLAIFDGMGCAS